MDVIWLGFIVLCVAIYYGKAEVIFIDGSNLNLLRDQKHALGIATMKRNPNEYLNATPISTHMVPNHHTCQLKCLSNYNCSSINVAKNNGEKRCELLSTDKYVSKEKIVADSNYAHYSFPVSSSYVYFILQNSPYLVRNNNKNLQIEDANVITSGLQKGPSKQLRSKLTK